MMPPFHATASLKGLMINIMTVSSLWVYTQMACIFFWLTQETLHLLVEEAGNRNELSLSFWPLRHAGQMLCR